MTGQTELGGTGQVGTGRHGHVGEQEVSQPMTELGLLGSAGTTLGLDFELTEGTVCMAGSFSPSTFDFSVLGAQKVLVGFLQIQVS